MVFQNYALYPHMTVAENMAFSLKVAGVGKAERAARPRGRAAPGPRATTSTASRSSSPAASASGSPWVVPSCAAPGLLHGRTAVEPRRKLRVQTRTQIAALQQRLGVTTVYVTHDQVEAMTMGDRVAVLKDGVLQQVDTPLGLYDRPDNLFVAGFIGSPP